MFFRGCASQSLGGAVNLHQRSHSANRLDWLNEAASSLSPRRGQGYSHHSGCVSEENANVSRSHFTDLTRQFASALTAVVIRMVRNQQTGSNEQVRRRRKGSQSRTRPAFHESVFVRERSFADSRNAMARIGGLNERNLDIGRLIKGLHEECMMSSDVTRGGSLGARHVLHSFLGWCICYGLENGRWESHTGGAGPG